MTLASYGVKSYHVSRMFLLKTYFSSYNRSRDNCAVSNSDIQCGGVFRFFNTDLGKTGEIHAGGILQFVHRGCQRLLNSQRIAARRAEYHSRWAVVHRGRETDQPTRISRKSANGSVGIHIDLMQLPCRILPTDSAPDNQPFRCCLPMKDFPQRRSRHGQFDSDNAARRLNEFIVPRAEGPCDTIHISCVFRWKDHFGDFAGADIEWWHVRASDLNAAAYKTLRPFKAHRSYNPILNRKRDQRLRVGSLRFFGGGVSRQSPHSSKRSR